MKIINLLLIFLLIALIIISFYPYATEYFNSDNININLNYDNQIKKPRVIIPLYAPWRMYYPIDAIYPFSLQYQSSPFYPFFDQYNIYQNFVPQNYLY